MYVPAHFAMTEEQIRDRLLHLGSADLVTLHDDGMVATYLPSSIDPEPGEHGALLAHVARNNTQWSRQSIGESLVIAHVSDHYVSPSWLPSAAGHANATPTWDYVTVHSTASSSRMTTRSGREDVVRRLTERQESELEVHWSVDDTDEGFIEAMLRAVVGIELRITRIEGKAKMSQNKPVEDVEALVGPARAGGVTAGARRGCARSLSRRPGGAPRPSPRSVPSTGPAERAGAADRAPVGPGAPPRGHQPRSRHSREMRPLGAEGRVRSVPGVEPRVVVVDVEQPARRRRR